LPQEAADLALEQEIRAVDTVAAGQERRKLRRSVGRLDTAFLMLAAIIVLDTLGAVSSYGAQSFTWLIVMIIFFLVPYGLITAELGSAFPVEGGPYVWVKLAFGRASAAVVSLMYWVDNPIWLAGTLAITAMATFSTFFVNLSLAWQYVFGLIFIWVGIGTVIMALKFGKWVATGGAVVRVVLIAFFTLTVIFYAIGHGVHGFGGGAFKPTWAIFLAAAPILIFNLEGFELPSSASEELKNPRRDVPPCCSTGYRCWRSCWCFAPRSCPTWAASWTRCRPCSSSTGATRPPRGSC
jgi:glutamate:GABA antiporter